MKVFKNNFNPINILFLIFGKKNIPNSEYLKISQ